MKKKYLLMLFALMLFSCERGGDWERVYPQGFSPTELSFSAKGGNATITSQRDEWSFVDTVIINGEFFYFIRCDEILTGYWGTNLKPGVCSDSLFTVKYDILKKYIEIVEIESSWFKITKENSKHITVFIEPNLTGETRQIRFEAGYLSESTSISIIQLGE